MKRRTRTLQHVERRTVKIFAALLVMLVILYSYLVSQSIVNVLVRQNIEQEITTLGSEISALEFEYITRKERINRAYAYMLGYTAIEDKVFVVRRSLLSRSLTINDEI